MFAQHAPFDHPEGPRRRAAPAPQGAPPQHPDARNVISANADGGIYGYYDVGTTIQGNWIGTALSGAAAPSMGNGADGVYLYGSARDLIGGPTTGAGNVIADSQATGSSPGTEGDGIDLFAVTQISVQGNAIGVDATTQAAPNAGDGIWDGDPPLYNLPATTAILGNTIANNPLGGVQVGASSTDPVYAQIRQNVMVNNGQASGGVPGIVLTGEAPSGCTSGQTAGAPNDYLDCPTIQSVSTAGASGTAPANSTVDLYSAPSASDDEGQTLLGTVSADSSGHWSFTGSLGSGSYVTATATGLNSHNQLETSEFASAAQVS
jgi:hypothetical protein